MLTATATEPKTGVFLTAAWHNLAMLNFTVDPGILEGYVPAGTELDYWEDHVYVSIVGFQFFDTKVLGVPALFHRRFEEVNRTRSRLEAIAWDVAQHYIKNKRGTGFKAQFATASKEVFFITVPLLNNA